VGVGTAYWYNNNFHYIRNWQHLKDLKSAYPLPLTLMDEVPDYGQVHLPKTDAIMSRMQMIEIRLSWSQTEIDELVEKIQVVLKKILASP
jgi:8-amino-3,8-dideoxy-alpha-D-manno-octulosonate transaminase